MWDEFIPQNFFEIPSKINDVLKSSSNITKLYDWQEKCLNFIVQHENDNIICSLPTSSGKTLIAELLMLKELVVNNKNALFVLPYVSIVQEKISKFSVYSDKLNFVLEEYAGSKGTLPPKSRRSKPSLYIATIEKANLLLDAFIESQIDCHAGDVYTRGPFHNQGFASKLGVICIDELHMLGIESAGHRAAILENIITKVQYYNTLGATYYSNLGLKFLPIKLIGLSATLPLQLPQCGGLLPFMKARLFVSDFRPIELTEYLKVNGALYEVVIKNTLQDAKLKVVKYVGKERWPPYYCEKMKKLDPDQILNTIISGINSSESSNTINDISCLVFCPTKKNCLNMASTLTRLIEFLHKRRKRTMKLLKMHKEPIRNRHISDSQRVALALMSNRLPHSRTESPHLNKYFRSEKSCSFISASDLKSSIRKDSPDVCLQNCFKDIKSIPNLSILFPCSSNHATKDVEINVKDGNILMELSRLRKVLIHELSALYDPEDFNENEYTQTLDTTLNSSLNLTATPTLQHDLCNNEGASDNNVCPVLKRSIRYGIAYHHGGLTADERRLIENAFASGVLKILCCTSTLAAGVNLPANRVIIRSPFMGTRPINESQYTQMIGRAGRPLAKKTTFLTAPKNVEQATSYFICNINRHCQTLLDSINTGDESNCIRFSEIFTKCIQPPSGSLTDTSLRTTADNVTIVKNSLTSGLLLPENNRVFPTINQNAVINQKIANQGLKTLILSVIGLGFANSKDNLVILMNLTLYAQQTYLNPNFANNSGGSQLKSSDDSAWALIKPILDELGENRLIQVVSVVRADIPKAIYKVTQLGKAIFKSSIDIELGYRLYSDLIESQRLMVLSTPLHLLYLVTPYVITNNNKSSFGDIEIDWNVFFSRVSKFSLDQLKVMELVGIKEKYIVQRMTCQPFDKRIDITVVKRFYCTLILLSLWNGESVWDTSQTFRVDRGYIQNLFQYATSFAYALSNFVQEFDEMWALKTLLATFAKQFQHLVSKDLLPLIELSGVKIGRIRQLYNAGYKNLFHLANAHPEKLMKDIKFLSLELALQIISSAKILLKEKAESLEDEALKIMSQLKIAI